MLDTNVYQEFMNLHKERKDILQREKDIVAQMASMEPMLIEMLVSNDMTKLNIGSSMAYIMEDIKPIVSSSAAAVEVLKNNGFDEYVSEKYNWQQVKRLIKDVLEGEESLPACFDGIIDYKKEYKLRVRKA